ncbi:hypothetical protein I317_01044 [Kwoniella heveanensis CBS 569]|nr:hypothetical protein I317_01044 [Kwoniella heveanensis CBS 569]
MATVSLAWKPEDLFVQFKKPKDRTMDKFEQDFNNACKILSPEGEPPKPYFNRGRFDGSDWQTNLCDCIPPHGSLQTSGDIRFPR